MSHKGSSENFSKFRKIFVVRSRTFSKVSGIGKTAFENSKFLPLKIACKIFSWRNFCRRFSMVKNSNFQNPFLLYDFWDPGECFWPRYKNFQKFRFFFTIIYPRIWPEITYETWLKVRYFHTKNSERQKRKNSHDSPHTTLPEMSFLTIHMPR